MKLLFRSFVDDEKIEFMTEATLNQGVFSFQDKTDSSLISIYQENNSIILRRIGSSNQILVFKENQKTKSKYENNDGLSLDFEIFTLKAMLKEDSFFFHYKLILDGKELSNHKILGKVIK